MAYTLMKIMIEAKTFDAKTLLGKADIYFGLNRITQEQYNEIIGLINRA